MEHASMIAICLAGMALMGLVYVALFMRSSDDKPTHPMPRDTERKAHYKRWEDRL